MAHGHLNIFTTLKSSGITTISTSYIVTEAIQHWDNCLEWIESIKLLLCDQRKTVCFIEQRSDLIGRPTLERNQKKGLMNSLVKLLICIRCLRGRLL